MIEKIFSDLQQIASRPTFRIVLARVNEPFLDERTCDLGLETNLRFPEADLAFFSNASPLTEQTLLRLAKIRSVAFLNLSVNEHRPERYEQVMGLPFKVTMERLETIHSMKVTGALSFPVLVSRVGDNTEADGEFRSWVQERFPAFEPIVSVRGDWMGAVPQPLDPVPDSGCTQWYKLHFLADGKSPFCCMDAEARHGSGDPRTSHVVHEIYNNVSRRHLRLHFDTRLAVPQCKTCPQMV